MVWVKEEEEAMGEQRWYFVPTACSVKGHVCQLCRLVMARRLCQQELSRVDAAFSLCQPW